MLNAYVLDYYYSDERYEELLRRVPGKRLVCGHTHIPLSHGFNAKVLNPGSVGQPRDGDWRASYVTVEDIRYEFRLVPTWRAGFNLMKDLVEFHRVEYDLGKTVAKIESEPGLPQRLTRFLQHGGLHI
jgi:diadenosine tetraphosphatase ApaH/serine/threonine PP2A family protein phosphatase